MAERNNEDTEDCPNNSSIVAPPLTTSLCESVFESGAEFLGGVGCVCVVSAQVMSTGETFCWQMAVRQIYRHWRIVFLLHGWQLWLQALVNRLPVTQVPVASHAMLITPEDPLLSRRPVWERDERADQRRLL